MRSSRVSFWVGLVFGAIVAAAVLFSIYYVPRKGLSFGSDGFELTLVLDEAHGLHVGSPVQVSGIEAGEVSAMQIAEVPTKGWKVLATVEIHDGERFAPMLTTESVFQVTRSGLLGEMTVAVTPGGAGGPVAGQVLDAVPPTDYSKILDELGVVSTRIADFMDGREAGDPNLRRMLVDLQEAVRTLRDFLNKLPH